MPDFRGAICRLHQAQQPQQGARPISASAGQLYGTDGNPVVLKVTLRHVISQSPPDCDLIGLVRQFACSWCIARGLDCFRDRACPIMLQCAHVIAHVRIAQHCAMSSVKRSTSTAESHMGKVADACTMLQGLNWFGFETSATMVAGLWAGSSSLTQDFKTVVWRMKLLGFNAVRLPFSFKVCLECYFNIHHPVIRADSFCVRSLTTLCHAVTVQGGDRSPSQVPAIKISAVGNELRDASV